MGCLPKKTPSQLQVDEQFVIIVEDDVSCTAFSFIACFFSLVGAGGRELEH